MFRSSQYVSWFFFFIAFWFLENQMKHCLNSPGFFPSKKKMYMKFYYYCYQHYFLPGEKAQTPHIWLQFQHLHGKKCILCPHLFFFYNISTMLCGPEWRGERSSGAAGTHGNTWIYSGERAPTTIFTSSAGRERFPLLLPLHTADVPSTLPLPHIDPNAASSPARPPPPALPYTFLLAGSDVTCAQSVESDRRLASCDATATSSVQTRCCKLAKK